MEKVKQLRRSEKKTEHLTGCFKENFGSFFVEGSALKFFVRSGSSSVLFYNHIRTSVLEGINNKIKVLKRIAYGFRDNKYFFLRIKSAFKGKVIAT